MSDFFILIIIFFPPFSFSLVLSKANILYRREDCFCLIIVNYFPFESMTKWIKKSNPIFGCKRKTKRSEKVFLLEFSLFQNCFTKQLTNNAFLNLQIHIQMERYLFVKRLRCSGPIATKHSFLLIYRFFLANFHAEISREMIIGAVLSPHIIISLGFFIYFQVFSLAKTSKSGKRF